MLRRRLLHALLAGSAGLVLGGCRGADAGETALGTLQRPAAHWRPQLSAPAYAVLFEHDTEPPFSSPLNAEKRPGTYVCAACANPLFESATKFESGTGWPSFWAPIEGAAGTRSDRLLIVERTEYHCRRCGGHQGHVFDDGPAPTGQRWCNNGLALQFVPQGQPLPELRG